MGKVDDDGVDAIVLWLWWWRLWKPCVVVAEGGLVVIAAGVVGNL